MWNILLCFDLNRVINIISGQSINAVEQAFRVVVAYWKTLFVQVSRQHRMLWCRKCGKLILHSSQFIEIQIFQVYSKWLLWWIESPRISKRKDASDQSATESVWINLCQLRSWSITRSTTFQWLMIMSWILLGFFLLHLLKIGFKTPSGKLWSNDVGL